MVSAIASRKYERAALSRLFRFTLAIQPTVRAEHRSDRRGHHVADEVFWPLGVFPNGLGGLACFGSVLALGGCADLAATAPATAGRVLRAQFVFQ